MQSAKSVSGVGLAAALALIAGGPAAAEDIRFYPLESFSIVYRHEGTQTGTTVLHSRNYGHLRAELRDLTLTFAGLNQVQKERAVIDGRTITTVNLQTNTATRIENPIYDQIVAGIARQGGDGLAAGLAFIRAMGGAETGETKTIAGETCNVWTIPALQQQHCIAPDGLPLEVTSKLGGIPLAQVAVEVRRGDGGPDEAFVLDGIPVQEIKLPPGLTGQPPR